MLRDEQGSCESYFKYSKAFKAQMLDFGRIIENTVGSQSTEELDDALETLRSKWVVCMRNSQPMVLNLERVGLHFDEWTANSICPVGLLFDPVQGRIHEQYMTMVKPDENYDNHGNEKALVMGKDCSVVILTTLGSSEEDQFKLKQLIKGIPHADSFAKLTVVQ